MDLAITARQAWTALMLTALAAAMTVLLLMGLGPDWTRYAAATCTATRCFCETPRSGLIVQPANSVSSLGFVFAGFLMIALGSGTTWATAMPRQAAMLLGTTAIIVGLGSVMLHATLTLWGQFFDVVGMYLIGSFMLIMALARWQDIPARSATWAYVALSVALVAVLLIAPDLRRPLFTALLLAAAVGELIFARPKRAGVRTRYYLGGIAVMGLALVIWNLDQHLILCAPHSLLQGHAAWHLMGAMSLWLSFTYYRSERLGRTEAIA